MRSPTFKIVKTILTEEAHWGVPPFWVSWVCCLDKTDVNDHIIFKGINKKKMNNIQDIIL